jgi:hypothetical protein
VYLHSAESTQGQQQSHECVGYYPLDPQILPWESEDYSSSGRLIRYSVPHIYPCWYVVLIPTPHHHTRHDASGLSNMRVFPLRMRATLLSCPVPCRQTGLPAGW